MLKEEAAAVKEEAAAVKEEAAAEEATAVKEGGANPATAVSLERVVWL